MKFVTAIDEQYYPGLVALRNSIKANSPNTDLICITYGKKSFIDKVRKLGIKVISNPNIKARLPITKKWPVASKAMYIRLLIPELFDDEKIAWIDADCIVLKPLDKLDGIEFSKPVAAVVTSTTTLGQQIDGLKQGHDIRALFAGLLIFNTKVWREKQITQRCLEAMDEPLDFKYVVQSVLSYVLKGDFHEIDYSWQVFANRKESTPEKANILHYVGHLPWKTTMNNQDIWEKYA